MRTSRYFAVFAVLLLLTAVFTFSCGGEDDERAANVIHRLLLAAAAGDTSGLESFPGRLPDGLPVDPPLYPGADIVVSSRQPAPTTGLEDAGAAGAAGGALPLPVLYFIVLDTGASRPDVFDFYEEALDEDPWQLDATAATPGLDTIEFTNVEDLDISGAVSITQGGTDGRTSVLISMQDAGGFVVEPPPFAPGESLAVPKEFPEDVPVYPDSTVTGTAFFREPANESFLLILLTTDSQDDVIDFYKEAFEELEFILSEPDTLGLEERLAFRDEDRDIQGDIVADRSLEDRAFTEVRIQLQVNPAREPSDGDDESPTDAPEETDAPEDGGTPSPQ